MNTLSFLIKPASGRCNLRCEYCFYEDVSALRSCTDYGLMPETVLETLVQQALQMPGVRRVSFAFQGGEPMVRGLSFYRKLIELEHRYNQAGILIEHSIQTNGTLVDEEWARFFKENGFLVGLSIDGTCDNHNLNRVDIQGKGSWGAVEDGWSILQQQGVDTNAVCVVTGPAAQHGEAIYTNLKKLGFRYLQFIPCLDPMGRGRGKEPWSLSPEWYSHFLRTVFDLWYQDWDQGNYISVRQFDDYVHILTGRTPGTCATNGSCGRYLVIEGDGSVFPCDFYVLDEWNVGRIGEDSLEELLASPLSAKFCKRGHGYPTNCVGCHWLPLCGGGCQRDWEGETLHYYCPALKEFFQYAYPRLRYIAQMEQRMLFI